jgi:effector-binding domain-containing protein
MEYVIEMVERESLPALVIRKTVDVNHLPHVIGSAYEGIAGYLRDLGIEESKLGLAFVAYHNLDMQNLDVEIGFITDQEYPGLGEMNPIQVPAGRWVSFFHKGPYKEMGKGYAAAQAWMREHQLVPTGLAYEYYLNSPQFVPESELMTKVEFLVE